MNPDRLSLYGVVSALTLLQKRAILSVVDVALVPLCLYLSAFFRDRADQSGLDIWFGWPLLLTLMLMAGITSHALGLPQIRLNDFESTGTRRSFLFAVLISIAGALINTLIQDSAPWFLFATFGLLLFFGQLASRSGMKWILMQILNRRYPRTAVIIYGAGRTGIQLATALRHDPMIVPVGFVDDNPALSRVLVAGLPVSSPLNLPEIVKNKGVSKVLLAMPSLSGAKRARIVRQLEPLGVDVQALPSFAQLVGEAPLAEKLAPIGAAQFLQRSSFESDMSLAKSTFSGKSVLVTGAGGSIGSELCRQLLALQPRTVVLLDASELALYQIDQELSAASVTAEVVPVLGSVADGRLCRKIMSDHAVDVVMHAAAYKHVPLVELNQISALRNNVLGTKALADAAREVGVERFILVSTDKAVRPTNIMGASKRLAELIIQDMASRPGPLFSMVRFGNVLGSSGSVIPLFQDQIANGGPVTVTHECVTRYFMTIDEAARLLLISSALTRGGEVFVLDMGKPVAIVDLARQMIEAAGYTVRDAARPDGDIDIAITGLRPGEKLHEQLFLGEGRTTTEHRKITVAEEKCLSELEIATAIRDLRDAIELNDEAAARDVLIRWVEGALSPVEERHA